jgi:hypothetical protein
MLNKQNSAQDRTTHLVKSAIYANSEAMAAVIVRAIKPIIRASPDARNSTKSDFCGGSPRWVPDLIFGANISLNQRLSLRGREFSDGRWRQLKQRGFMIRYSSYGGTTSRRPRIQIIYLDRLEVEYRKVQELRERVRKAEAAAALRKGRPVLSRPIPDPKHRR